MTFATFQRHAINVHLSFLYIWFWCSDAPARQGFQQSSTNVTRRLISRYVPVVGGRDFK